MIRGETSHYDIVAGESARGLMELAVRHGALIGNGILTTDNGAQARVRAPTPRARTRAAHAARAALALLQLKARLRRMTRRRAARFGAIQALYQAELSGVAVEQVIAEFQAHRLADLLEPLEGSGPPPAVDRAWFAALTQGAWQRAPELDPMIEATLAEGWTLVRAGYLLRACLRAGAFELAARPDVPGARRDQRVCRAGARFPQPRRGGLHQRRARPPRRRAAPGRGAGPAPAPA